MKALSERCLSTLGGPAKTQGAGFVLVLFCALVCLVFWLFRVRVGVSVGVSVGELQIVIRIPPGVEVSLVVILDFFGCLGGGGRVDCPHSFSVCYWEWWGGGIRGWVLEVKRDLTLGLGRLWELLIGVCIVVA